MATGEIWQRLDSIVARLYREQAEMLRDHARDDRTHADILTAAAQRLEECVRQGARERWH